MNKPWPKVKLGEVLRPNKRPYTLGPEEDANLVGMRLYGEGPFHRELKPAMQISKKSHFVIRAGDVIYNKLFAWKGTFGIVPQELDGMFVSDKFPTYELNREKVDENFLSWYFKCPPLWEEARTMSTGSAALSKLTLNPPKFLLLTIPLAPLAEQRRVVARIEELAAQIHEARNLRHEATEEAEALLSSAQSALSHPVTADSLSIEDLVGEDGLRNGKSVKSCGVESEIRCLTLSAMRNGRIDIRDSKPVPMSRTEAEPFQVRTGDVFVIRGNGSKHLCGLAGLIADEAEGVIFPDLFIQVALPKEQVVAEFFVAAWNSSATRAVIEEKAKTTSGIWKINQGHILSTRVPVPPLAEQRRIVAELDALQAEVDALKRLQAETAAELDAFLPAILDRAFKGEL
jgi:type I restriction enzyme S subunit